MEKPRHKEFLRLKLGLGGDEKNKYYFLASLPLQL